jgi:hypothetical protein
MRSPERVIVLIAALAVCLPPSAIPEEPASGDPLAPLAHLLGGEWVARGADVNEREATRLDIVVTYRWGVNRKHIRSESSVVRDGERHLEFEAMIGWHPRDKTLVFFAFSADGTVFEGTVTASQGVLEFRWEAFEKNNVKSYRQNLRFSGSDEYVSGLFVRGSGGWERISEATFRRRSTK